MASARTQALRFGDKVVEPAKHAAARERLAGIIATMLTDGAG